MSKPAVLVARAIFPDVVERLAQHFTVESNPADVVWDQAELVARLQGKQGVLTTASERIDGPLLAACPALRVCANMAVGFNNFDLPAMRQRGVVATNTPCASLTETTADFGFALLMAAARRVTESERHLRAGLWHKWHYEMFSGCDIHGSTLGIIGMGRIGQGLAKRAHGFDMRVLYHDISALSPAQEAACRATWVDKEELLRTADHVVVVVPYSPATHHTIGAAELRRMKPTATLVNLARGGIVDDAALAAALRGGRIAAAGLDVFEGEPRVHPGLLAAPNVVLTPHIGSATATTRRAMADLAADNLIGFLVHGAAKTPVAPAPANA
jgi:gluconate 2-dehydrogenase